MRVTVSFTSSNCAYYIDCLVQWVLACLLLVLLSTGQADCAQGKDVPTMIQLSACYHLSGRRLYLARFTRPHLLQGLVDPKGPPMGQETVTWSHLPSHCCKDSSGFIHLKPSLEFSHVVEAVQLWSFADININSSLSLNSLVFFMVSRCQR